MVSSIFPYTKSISVSTIIKESEKDDHDKRAQKIHQNEIYPKGKEESHPVLQNI